jgi:hypothetical protein
VSLRPARAGRLSSTVYVMFLTLAVTFGASLGLFARTNDWLGPCSETLSRGESNRVWRSSPLCLERRDTLQRYKTLCIGRSQPARAECFSRFDKPSENRSFRFRAHLAMRAAMRNRASGNDWSDVGRRQADVGSLAKRKLRAVLNGVSPLVWAYCERRRELWSTLELPVAIQFLRHADSHFRKSFLPPPPSFAETFRMNRLKSQKRQNRLDFSLTYEHRV